MRLGSRVVLAALLATLAGACNRSEDYRWTASSSSFGFPASGTMSQTGQQGLLFHTADEANPWVVVDLLEERSITGIVVQNRLDCCQERGLPMVVELGDKARKYVEVARRTTPFDTWEIGVIPTRVRYLKVRSEAKTILHLSAIEIR